MSSKETIALSSPEFLFQCRASTDDFLGLQANTSNLALKGIIALSAMQEIQTALNITGNNTYGVSTMDYTPQLFG